MAGDPLKPGQWRPPVDEEVASELEFHVEMRARELETKGLSPDAAHDAAVRRFGNLPRVNAACQALGRERDDRLRRAQYVAEFRSDVRYALRQLWRHPGFAAVAVITLALGIGATTAIFSAVHAIVWQPLPFEAPDRIVRIYEELNGRPGNVSTGNFVDGIEPLASFAATALVQTASFNFGDGTPERVFGARVNAGYFGVFKLAPAIGRVFTAAEDQPGFDRVVVLSHRLWIRRFAADPAIVGREIRVDDAPFQVVGVMPETFDLTAQSEELWVPIALTPERRAQHDAHMLQSFGRLAGGVTLAQAIAELRTSGARLRESFPLENQNRSLTAADALGEITEPYRDRLFTSLGAVAFVMLIACVNLANLLVARGATREDEMAVRTSLGAGRLRLLRQLLTESLVLSAVAAALGLILAFWILQALIAAAPPGIPRLDRATLSPLVLAFAMALAIASAIAFGLLPALRVAGLDPIAALRGRTRGVVGGRIDDRLRKLLIAAELAVAFVLLVGAGLLIRTALALERTPTGFDPTSVYSARVSLPSPAYIDPARVTQTFGRLAEALARQPGITHAAITSQVPMGAGGNSNGLLPEGAAPDVRHLIDGRLRMITPHYFEVMRIPIVKGRAIDARDRRGALKVMVISQSLAAAAFPNQDPIGRRIACCEDTPDGPDFKTVVGVAGDVRWRSPGLAPTPELYLPIEQVPPDAWDWTQRTMYLVARSPGTADDVRATMRRVAGEVAPGVPLFSEMPMADRLQTSLAASRFNAWLLSLLGGVGLVLSVVGIYGVIAYLVARRSQEIGVRMALGATRAGIVRLMLGQAMGPVAIGLVTGLALAASLTGFLSAQLFGVSAYDPVTFAVVISLLAGVALAACLIPSSRAAAIDPTSALRP